MLSRYRYALIGLALLGLGVSVTALVVHYRLMTDPSYSSFCDISATVSCQQVLESSYATVKGIPIASGGAIWSAAVLLLAFWGMRQPSSELAGRVAGYIFVLATMGLAVVFYYGYASFFKLGAACPLCITMYVSVAGIFLVSAAAATSLTAIPARLGEDLSGLTKSQSGTTLAVGWIAASIALLVLFPHPGQVGSASAGSDSVDAAPAPPVETLTPESDFTPFMKPEVDADVKRAALRTLFRDPRYNVMDGLDVYIDDYSKPDPIPQEWLGQLNQLAHLGDVHAREAEKAARAENAPEPAGIEEKTEPQQVVDAAEEDDSSHTDNKELPPPEVRHS